MTEVASALYTRQISLCHHKKYRIILMYALHTMHCKKQQYVQDRRPGREGGIIQHPGQGSSVGSWLCCPTLPPVCLNYPISAILLFIPQQSMLIQFQIHQWMLLLSPIINNQCPQIYLQCLRMKRVTVMRRILGGTETAMTSPISTPELSTVPPSHPWETTTRLRYNGTLPQLQWYSATALA